MSVVAAVLVLVIVIVAEIAAVGVALSVDSSIAQRRREVQRQFDAIHTELAALRAAYADCARALGIARTH